MAGPLLKLLLTSRKCVLTLKLTIQRPLGVQRGHSSVWGAYEQGKKGDLRPPESSLQLLHFGWKKILRKLAHPLFKWQENALQRRAFLGYQPCAVSVPQLSQRADYWGSCTFWNHRRQCTV